MLFRSGLFFIIMEVSLSIQYMGIYKGRGARDEDQSKGKTCTLRKGGTAPNLVGHGFPTRPLGPTSHIFYVSKTPKNPVEKIWRKST